jgi:malate dehydrogenase (oxaloacetate-decarboxylating)
MENTSQQSLDLHKAHGGKLEIASKVPLSDRHDLSLAYTPGVAAVCTEIARDKSLARTYTLKGNSVAVVTDGSAILGLGNLGPEAAIPVMEGKAILFKKFANIDAFPICLDTQDTEEIIKAVQAIAPVFGGINLEDIAAPRCFEIEARLKELLDIPVMHDDQHGTATVVLAGLINALALVGKEAASAKVVVNGAGAAGAATVDLMLKYGFRDIIVCDRKGAIVRGREDLAGYKFELAERTNPRGIAGDLSVAMLGADIFIGVSGPGLLTSGMASTMNEKAIIFALANPVPEIMPDEAKKAGAYIVATGRSDFPNQVNNALVFPGVFRGALDNQVKTITDEMLIAAAKALAAHVKTPTTENIIPSIFDDGVATAVAKAIK